MPQGGKRIIKFAGKLQSRLVHFACRLAGLLDRPARQVSIPESTRSHPWLPSIYRSSRVSFETLRKQRMFSSAWRRSGVYWLIAALAWIAGSSTWADDAIQFNRDIRPILSENCFRCHGPDSASRKADLRLDKRAVAIEMGAIEPGKPGDSSLIERIFSTDPKEMMPPPSTRKELTAAQKDLLQRWVAAGAEYEPHWSFIPPQRPAPPAVKNPAWAKTPIDRFILARLEAAGLQPAAEADRRTLARRASFDLTGLPPAPEQVEQFVNDTAQDAYEKYVDRLLALPQWGEHRARYWLDAARYADTHGIHIDNYREMWSYRDWVIKAFNRNVPFDRFTIEQLAGDLLPNRTLDEQVASGFNRCNITTSEGGAIDEEYLVLYTRDRTETTSQVWLGLTAGCAVCHDHKFDPLTQKEFYELAAFFNNTTQRAMDGNVKDTPPIVQVPALEEDRQRFDAIPGELADARKQSEARKQSARPDFDAWLQKATPDELTAATANAGLLLHAPLSEGTGKTLDFVVAGQTRPIATGNIAWEDGHVAPKALKIDTNAVLEIPDVGDFERDQPLTLAAWIKLTQPNQSGAIIARMDEKDNYRGWDFFVQGNRIGMHLINLWPQDAIKTIATTEVKLNEWHHVLVTYDGSGDVAGIKVYYDGEPQATAPEANKVSSTTRTATPLKLAQRSNGGSRLNNAVLQDLRVYGRALDANDIASLSKGQRIAALAQKPADQRTDAEKNELYQGWLTAIDPAYKQLQANQSQLQQEEAAIKARATIAHVMQERTEPASAFMLFRGEYDKRRDQVSAATPSFLPPMPEDLPKNRLGLAQWLLRPEHPLTTRVTVNRFWQEVFGTGLVRSAGDFGVSGELPSHPELLDWMAVELRESGWDVKKFYRMLVTSATYRQAATVTPDKLEKDGQNRLLSRGPRFRMDAEMIRDAALASSGLLVRKIGGPSVKPYQPDGVWEAVAMIGSNTRDYVRDRGESLYRRSLYTFWKRSAPPASMDVFNAPSREVCTVRRERTNTPLQALVTLNDPQFVEAARILAQRALLEGGDKTATRLDFIAHRLLARPLRKDELPIVEASLNDLTAHYQTHADDARLLLGFGDSQADAKMEAPTLAAWTMLANELMNLDEVLNK
jgi:hypothetical protein